jgi:hypothetical protein
MRRHGGGVARAMRIASGDTLAAGCIVQCGGRSREFGRAARLQLRHRPRLFGTRRPAGARHPVSAFEACRCRRTWSGLHEQNELDGNPIYTVERSRFGKGRRHRILVPFQTEARSLYVTHDQAGRIWGIFYVGGGR